jgi:hypothetical protein
MQWGEISLLWNVAFQFQHGRTLMSLTPSLTICAPLKCLRCYAFQLVIWNMLQCRTIPWILHSLKRDVIIVALQIVLFFSRPQTGHLSICPFISSFTSNIHCFTHLLDESTGVGVLDLTVLCHSRHYSLHAQAWLQAKHTHRVGIRDPNVQGICFIGVTHTLHVLMFT